MRELKRKRGVVLFGSLTALRSMGIVVGVLGVIALICVFACQQTTGVRPSAATPGKVSARETVPTLTNALCVVCHPQQPQTIKARGEKHKTKVGCLDCHTEHPPEGADAIPACSMCHSGKAHYELEQCASCHSDTHAPLDIKLEGEVSEPCLSCHPQQGDEVEKHPSAHTDVACNECHAVHRQIPDCTDCHEKHTEDMDFNACVSCHPVHMPLVVTYKPETPSHYCGACHEEALDLLAKNTTKHHDLSCAFCHKNEHKVVPPCFACHPDPHPKAILDKFPECGQCHDIAHDLKG
ncbi:MAG: cytochrome c3 family protein [Planctomycetota bacterium]|jgi:hypothetical protein